MEQITNNFNSKLNKLCLLLILFFLLISSRLFYLQIYLNKELTKLSQKNFTRTSNIQSPRGDITDRSGHLFATNKPVKNLFWSGTGLRSLSKEQVKNISILEDILEIELNINNIKVAEKYGRKLRLVKDLDFKKLTKIAEFFGNNKNITILTGFKRYYPQKNLASHVIGYLGAMNLEKMGRMGLEKMFERDLKGQTGKQLSTINSTGKQITQTEIIKSVSGKTIKTTIDLHLQKIAESSFPKNYKGALILMDPTSGAIRAMISKPNFNPEIFLKPMSKKTWQELQESKPFVNRALNASYPPASIFKLVTIAAALELELITPETELNCRGYITFGKRRYHCNRQTGHGYLTTQQALAQSCNIPCYELGKQLTIDKLAQYSEYFGLGIKTDIIFPEQAGLVPTKSWKLKTKGEPWWIGETLSAAIGQSFLLVTPVQIARMIGSIFQGYLVTPRILHSEEPEKKELKIKQETLNFLQESMRLVVTKGTGRKLGKIPGMNIFAKTGTAQTCALSSKRKTKTSQKDHIWFASNFKYENQNPMVLVILIENAGATRIALAAARNFLKEYQKIYN